MNYSIVYSSKTGNTTLLAEKIKSELSLHNLHYFGPPTAEGSNTDTIFIGFWTDKGTCDDTLKSFIQSLKNKNIILFGTAGFGGSKTYFNQIINGITELIHESSSLKGSFMCQGKMPLTVRERYVQALEKDPSNTQMKNFLENFDCALNHPSKDDLSNLSHWLHSIL